MTQDAILVSEKPQDPECEDFILKGKQAWITVGNISVQIKHGDEGVSVCLYPLDGEDGDTCLGETWATFSEASGEESND